MAEQSLAEQIKSEIQSLQSAVEDLQSTARLADIRDSVEDLDGEVSGLSRRINSLRDKGYAFEKSLEETATDFHQEWIKKAPRIRSQIEKEAGVLERSLRPLDAKMSELAGKSASPRVLSPLVKSVKAQVEALENRVEAAADSIRGEFDQIQSDVNQFEYHLGKLEWTLEEISEASFDLLATESGIMAVKAVWAQGEKQKKDDPKGVLFLTDQRIIFEQKEKIATKKVLFIATEKELVQKTHWDIPVVLVDEVKSRDEGFLGKDDYIDLQFESGAPIDLAYLHVWQPGEDWVSLINRAKSGDFDQDRAIPIDQAVLDRVKNAPTKCPSCGGTINQPILRGMENISCEYCGDVIRL
jgi:predicted  nucleic acid-binding Zn-ribbon protein